jgi:hypothetical protein
MSICSGNLNNIVQGAVQDIIDKTTHSMEDLIRKAVEDKIDNLTCCMEDLIRKAVEDKIDNLTCCMEGRVSNLAKERLQVVIQTQRSCFANVATSYFELNMEELASGCIKDVQDRCKKRKRGGVPGYGCNKQQCIMRTDDVMQCV